MTTPNSAPQGLNTGSPAAGLDRLITLLDCLTDACHGDDCNAFGKPPDADAEDKDSEIDDNPLDYLEHCDCGLKDAFEAWKIAKSLSTPAPREPPIMGSACGIRSHEIPVDRIKDTCAICHPTPAQAPAAGLDILKIRETVEEIQEYWKNHDLVKVGERINMGALLDALQKLVSGDLLSLKIGEFCKCGRPYKGHPRTIKGICEEDRSLKDLQTSLITTRAALSTPVVKESLTAAADPRDEKPISLISREDLHDALRYCIPDHAERNAAIDRIMAGVPAPASTDAPMGENDLQTFDKWWERGGWNSAATKRGVAEAAWMAAPNVPRWKRLDAAQPGGRGPALSGSVKCGPGTGIESASFDGKNLTGTVANQPGIPFHLTGASPPSPEIPDNCPGEGGLRDALDKCPLGKSADFRNGWMEAISYLRTMGAMEEGSASASLQRAASGQIREALAGLRVYGFDMDPEGALDDKPVPPHWTILLPITEADKASRMDIRSKQEQILSLLAKPGEAKAEPEQSSPVTPVLPVPQAPEGGAE